MSLKNNLIAHVCAYATYCKIANRYKCAWYHIYIRIHGSHMQLCKSQLRVTHATTNQLHMLVAKWEIYSSEIWKIYPCSLYDNYEYLQENF
jgi:hypothetical protein